MFSISKLPAVRSSRFINQCTEDINRPKNDEEDGSAANMVELLLKLWRERHIGFLPGRELCASNFKLTYLDYRGVPSFSKFVGVLLSTLPST